MGSSSHLSSSYDQDFYAWAMENADLLRQKKFEEIDFDNIAEEIESMGKGNKRSVFSHLSVLIAHLLKWKFQSVRRSKSWSLTIKNQRFEISDLLNESPSLKNEVKNRFDHAYKKAVILASQETSIDEKEFSTECPFSLDQCLDDDFFPD